MILWPSIVAFVIGWVLTIRPALRRHMLVDLCEKCHRSSGEGCDPAYGYHRGTFRPRGALRERTDGDVATAIFVAFFWPFRMVFRTIALLATAAGSGIKFAILRATPLTQPELERRLRDQQAEIARLTKQIGGES